MFRASHRLSFPYEGEQAVKGMDRGRYIRNAPVDGTGGVESSESP
jgi:hypothetical protein